MEDTLGENLVNTESFKAVTVLILVLMEDTLGVSFFVPTGIFSHVLILVLMEDTLGEVKYTDNSNFFFVLILVLMEDTLGEVVETVGNEVYTKS